MSAQRFRKRPVEIEARQIRQWGDVIGSAGIALWCGGAPVRDKRGAGLEIATLEGVMRADIGDWIIKGVAGEFYPCKPDIFEATYEPVGAGTDGGERPFVLGEEWETAVTIGYDALRLSLGMPPKRWTKEDVKRWLDCMDGGDRRGARE